MSLGDDMPTPYSGDLRERDRGGSGGGFSPPDRGALWGEHQYGRFVGHSAGGPKAMPNPAPWAATTVRVWWTNRPGSRDQGWLCLPASSTSTRCAGSALSRFARTDTAAPAPTTI